MNDVKVTFTEFFEVVGIVVEALLEIQKDESYLREITIKNSMQLVVLTKYAQDNGLKFDEKYFRSPTDILEDTKNYNEKLSLLHKKINELTTLVIAKLKELKE